jgi:hypothetical protein
MTIRPTFVYTTSKDDVALGSISSANWRGYIASWKIANYRLWLVEFHGRLEEGRPQEKPSALIDIGLPKPADSSIENHRLIVATIEALPEISFGIRQSNKNWLGSSIPDTNGFVDRELANGINIEELYNSDINPVSAAWYSGLLRIPMGEQLEYHHAGFLTVHETDLIIEIEAGTVRRQWLIDNKIGFHARKQAGEIRQKSFLSTVSTNENGNESEYRDAVKEPLEAIRTLTKTNTNHLHESIHHFLRSHFFLQAAGSAVMSQTDQEARVAYDKAISQMNGASVAIGLTIGLRREIASDAAALSELPLNDFAEIMLMKTAHCKQAWELMLDLHIPSDDRQQIEWAIDNIRSTEHLIAKEQFELLCASMSIIYEFAKANSPA